MCQAVTYEADQLVGPYVYCHCQSCRKANGSAFGANIAVPSAAFRLLRGAEQLRCFESSPGIHRYFCGGCGSPIYKAVGANPEMIRLRLGTLDTPFAEQAVAHIFTGEKAPWYHIVDELPKFKEFPDPRSLTLHGSRQSSE